MRKPPFFLVLVRNASAIRKRHSLASWLHGVALRIAHKTRARSARQRTREREVLPPSPHTDPFETLATQELRAALDEEIERLPDKYRTPLILCYLAEKTHEQAASELGWSNRSLTARLAFSLDGRFLAAVGGGGNDKRGETRVWNLEEGTESRSWEGRFGPVDGVIFSPDGRTLASGYGDGLLVLWGLASGRQRHRFLGHEGGIQSLAFSPHGRRLAASSVDAPVYVWDVAGTLERRPRRLSNEESQHCWTALAGEDAPAAFGAIRRLAAVPAQTLPFLRERLKPVPAPDLPRVRQLLKALDSDAFTERQKAAAELAKCADAASSLLRQTIKDKPSLYVRRTLQQILESLETTPDSLRAVRAVEVVEWIATPDAIRLLDELAKGTADARLTREADAARKRLHK